MSVPFPKSYPQPSAEWIAQTILHFAKLRFFVRTIEREEPLFKCGLVLPKLGKNVMVELLPSLALRVRDTSTGHVLAQSMPGNFDKLDMAAPTIEEMFLQWQQQRETLPVSPPDAQQSGGEA